MRSEARQINRNARTRREAISDRLLVAVEALLDAGVTYPDLSVGQLAGASGISRSSFYLYFPDKAELFAELAGDVVQELGEKARAIWSLPPTAGFDAVLGSVGEVVETYERHRNLLSAVIDAATSEPMVKERYRSIVEISASDLAAHMRAGQEAGSVTPELDPDLSAPWFIWMIERGLYGALGGAGSVDVAETTDTVARIIWRTLYSGFRTA